MINNSTIKFFKTKILKKKSLNFVYFFFYLENELSQKSWKNFTIKFYMI